MNLLKMSHRAISNGFPKHKELFAEDYYEPEGETQTNPYDNPINSNDFDIGGTRSTATGILSSYKKQINLTPQDVMERDHWKSMENLK